VSLAVVLAGMGCLASVSLAASGIAVQKPEVASASEMAAVAVMAGTAEAEHMKLAERMTGAAARKVLGACATAAS